MPSFERREVHLTLPVARDMEIAATAQVAVLGELLQLGIEGKDRSAAILERGLEVIARARDVVEIELIGEPEPGGWRRGWRGLGHRRGGRRGSEPLERGDLAGQLDAVDPRRGLVGAAGAEGADASDGDRTGEQDVRATHRHRE